MARFANISLDLERFGMVWQDLRRFGTIRQDLPIFNKIWQDLDRFGEICYNWQYLAIFVKILRSLVSLVDIFGEIWINSRRFRNIRQYLTRFGKSARFGKIW